MMEREQSNRLLNEIRPIRNKLLVELHDLTEDEFELPVDYRSWKWDTVLQVMLQIGNQVREYTVHLNGTRAKPERLPSQAQHILAEAERSWGDLQAAAVGPTDTGLDLRAGLPRGRPPSTLAGQE